MNRKNQRTKKRKISGELYDRLESATCRALENGMPADKALAINAYHLMALMQFVTGGEAPIGTAFALDVMAGYLKDKYQPDSLKIDDDIAEITIDSNFFFIGNDNLRTACLLRALAEHITESLESPESQSLTPRNCLH